MCSSTFNIQFKASSSACIAMNEVPAKVDFGK